MAHSKKFQKELERCRAIAAALLLEDPSSAVLKTAKGFVDRLAPGYRRALVRYLDWYDDYDLGAETALRIGPKNLSPRSEYETIAQWQQKRRGVIMRLCFWGWNPYQLPKPSGVQRERGRERVTNERQPEL